MVDSYQFSIPGNFDHRVIQRVMRHNASSFWVYIRRLHKYLRDPISILRAMALQNQQYLHAFQAELRVVLH